MMREARRISGKHQQNWLFLLAIMVLGVSSYTHQVSSLPTDVNSVHPWPIFPKKNIASLARGGYLKSLDNFKRSISTLAKNGQLPTFRSPYDETDKQEDEDEETNEKRNIASVARMRSYAAMKRNIQALARDGYRLGGRGQYSQQNDKRNVQSLARNGMIHKKDFSDADEFYYPFYQNPIPPLSEIDRPFDMNELYDYQQSVNPDMLPPLSQVFKRSLSEQTDGHYSNELSDNSNDNWYWKRGSVGMPALGLLRPTFIEPNTRSKRYILAFPDVIDKNDNEHDDPENDKRSVEDETDDVHSNFDKRHIGSLARLGLLPSFRYSGGRYSRSGRARLLWPSQELYRKHSYDPHLGIREYISDAETDSAADSDYADVPPEAVPPNSHPTGRILNRPLNNDLPAAPAPPHPSPQLPHPNIYDAFDKNRWQSRTKEIPKFYYFRSLKVPYHTSGKRYLLLPAVDNIMLRKTYPNSSLPSRRKNQ